MKRKKLREYLNIEKIQKNNKTYYTWHGIKLFSRRKKITEAIKDIQKKLSLLDNIQKKLSMVNNTWRFNDTFFYVPNYPYDFIQQLIVNSNNYFEIDILKELEEYIPENATILDIGANIGNHSIYWAKEMNAKKIIAFEPIKDTFDILKKNIELNGLDSIVEIYNFGLSDSECCAKSNWFGMLNIGGTSLAKSDTGTIQLKRLDDFDFTHIEKIDFVKIDVELHEIFMLEGARETLKKYKPIIFIESFSVNKDKVFSILHELGYELKKEFPDWNFLFLPTN